MVARWVRWGGLLCAVSLVLGCSDAQTAPADLRVEDLAGARIDPFAGDLLGSVFVFVGVDCPISNRYAPEIRRLADEFEPQGIGFWLVYADPDADSEAIRQHRALYGLELPTLRDAEHALVRAAGVQVTPETAVFDARRRRVYFGRIDDRFVSFGKARPAPTRRELDSVLTAFVAGEPSDVKPTPAVGCSIPGPS